jgi:hypothetical protein
LGSVALVLAYGALCARVCAQDPQVEMEEVSLPDTPASTDAPATVDGSQVIARINGQIVQACEILWMVNLMIEKNRDRIPAKQLDGVRGELMKRQLAGLVDRKLLYNKFREEVPPENMPRIEEQLAPQFEEHELPLLMKQLNVSSKSELERELCRLGSSLTDARRTFDERVIAGEWLRKEVKIDEDVSPIDIHDYYQDHLKDYDFPAQVRWEELMIRKDRFKEPAQAYAELANLGNEAAKLAAANSDPKKPIFADVAKAKSDGITAKSGGQYDWTNQGSLATAAIDDALFKLTPGQMSLIVEGKNGFHIVRVLERKDGGRKPFTDVQVDIRDKIKKQRMEDAQDKYLAQLRSEARIETIYTGRITADELASKYGEGPGRR